MQPRNSDQHQMRAVEYPAKPLGSLAKYDVMLQARHRLDLSLLRTHEQYAMLPADQCFLTAKSGVLATRSMNPLPASPENARVRRGSIPTEGLKQSYLLYRAAE